MAGALYTENLFKKGSNRFSFMEQQFWLYLYSSIVALIIHHAVHPSYWLDTAIMDVLLGNILFVTECSLFMLQTKNYFLDLNPAQRQLFFLALFCSSIVGLLVAW